MPTKTTQTGSETASDRRRHARCPPAGGSAAAGGKPLVIVESPTKANKIAGYLGSGYVVEASVGHIRDLPRNAADVPAEHKGAALGPARRRRRQRLRAALRRQPRPQAAGQPSSRQLVKDASELYLATDEDREGEAIAWHLVDTLKPRVPVRRMVFHEITPRRSPGAVANPRELDTALVDAQETRRILDRLYGYEVSPVLWKKVLPKLSAGRVQSVATRIVVERERERMALPRRRLLGPRGHVRRRRGRRGHRRGRADHRSRPRWSASTTAGSPPAGTSTPATGRVTGDVVHLDEAGARGLAARLEGAPGSRSRRVDEKPYRRRPYAPFMTSTLQQEAGRKLRLVLGADDAGRAAAVRERLHHLHAYRLDEPVRDGDQRRPAAGPRAVRRRLRAGRGRAATRARSRTPRRRTRRSARPATPSARPGSWPRSSAATSSGSTS